MAELEACRVTDEAVVVGLYPDVCLTPPNSTPVPYTVIARFSDGVRSRPTVRFRGVEAMTDFGRLSRVYGDEAGVGGGVTSGVNMGMCRPQTFSSSVRINGQAVVRHDDFVEMNCASPDGPANTRGKVMYVPVGAPLPVGPMGEVAGDTNPPVEPETEEEGGFWSSVGDGLATAGKHSWGFVKGVGGGVKDLAVGVYDIGKFGVQSGAIGYLTDREQFYANWEAMGNAGGAAAGWVPTIWNEPGQAWSDTKGVLGAMVEPITEPWGRGDYGEAIGRGAFEVAAIVFGPKGLDKAARAGSTGARVAGLADDAVRLTDDVARAAADDAARAAGGAVDDVVRAGDDGLRVVGGGLRPRNFGLRTIADDPKMHRLWEEALRNKATSSRSNAYKRYLDAIERGDVPTQDMAEAAYSTVRSEFGKLADAAGRPLGEAQVHHWNYPKGNYPFQVTDPRNLVIAPDRAAHEAIHRATSGTSDIWGGPIDPRHVLSIDESAFPLAPGS